MSQSPQGPVPHRRGNEKGDVSPPAEDTSVPREPTRANFFPWLIAVGLILLVCGLGYRIWNGPRPQPQASQEWYIPAEFNGERAFGYLQEVVACGPRPSGSHGMQQQQQLLESFFRQQAADVRWQTFSITDPETGATTPLKNLIARFRPQAGNRVLLCTHYDTLPPLPETSQSTSAAEAIPSFLGANDGGSGVAALMEFSHHIDRLPESMGIDIVFFDGKSLAVPASAEGQLLGANFFAKQYVGQQETERETFVPYQAGVLLDMVGDRELQLYYERNSWNYAREQTVEIWSTAKRLDITAFRPRIKHVVRDDHLPLNRIAHIPTAAIIDFDYPRPGLKYPTYRSSPEDTLDKCSGQSLVAVVYVLHQWLQTAR